MTPYIHRDMNFGLALRPQTKLPLEKHITRLKITPNGVGVQPIIDASIDNNGHITGINSGLSAIKSNRQNRGYWKVETDIEEIAQGAQVEVEYTYSIKNESEEDYLSKEVINEYKNLIDKYEWNKKTKKNENSYSKYLINLAEETKNAYKGKTNLYGNYLGQYYYTGKTGENDVKVPSRIEVNGIEESINNNLSYDDKSKESFIKVVENGQPKVIEKRIFDEEGKEYPEKINTTVTTIKESNFIEKGQKDDSNKLVLSTVLASTNYDKGYYPSYMAEITKYSNAAGRKDMTATPQNLQYAHCKDTDVSLINSYIYEDGDKLYISQDEGGIKANENDEFWGEDIIITKPTGENKQMVKQITITIISSVAVLVIGIALIKKFTLKK